MEWKGCKCFPSGDRLPGGACVPENGKFECHVTFESWLLLFPLLPGASRRRQLCQEILLLCALFPGLNDRGLQEGIIVTLAGLKGLIDKDTRSCHVIFSYVVASRDQRVSRAVRKEAAGSAQVAVFIYSDVATSSPSPRSLFHAHASSPFSLYLT